MATIDIGAHSARMLIAEVNVSDRSFVELEELEMPVPLGSNVFRTAMISDESIQILCGILRNFKQKMEEYGVTHCRAIATSAVREAGNAEIFIERIRHATGIVKRQDSRLRIQKCLILMRIIALAAFRFRSGRHVFFLLLLQLVGNRPIIH